MLLSIVMMVKNEAKVLERTLNSLRPLLETIKSELIIMDTGSTDNTVEIAKKYTSNIYFKNWSGNFSDMRNKSISFARGEWILILDADEVLIEFENIINFFKHEEFKKYNSASIKLKNIYSEKKENYGYVSLVRMFRNDGVLYYGKIHEQPKYKKPIFNNLAEFEHYGYLFNDDEDRIRKMKRNEELLLEELEENPNDPYIYYQLCQNFLCEGKVDKAEQSCEKAFEIYEKHGIKIPYVYETLTKIYIMKSKYKECEKICKSYINHDKNNIDIYYYFGMSQMKQSKLDEAINSFDKYLNLVGNYNITTQATDIFSECNTMDFKDYVFSQMVDIYHELKKYNLVLDKFEKINKISEKKRCYRSWISALEKLNKFDLLLKYESSIKSSYTEKSDLYSAIELQLIEIDKDNKNKMYEKLSNIDGNYGILNKIRVNQTIDENQLSKLLKSVERQNFYGTLIEIALNNDINIYSILEELDSTFIYEVIGYAISQNKNIGIQIYNYLMKCKNTFDIEQIRVYKILMELILNMVSLSEEKYENLFYIYSLYSYQYIKSLYDFKSDNILIKHLGSADKFILEFRYLIENEDSLEFVEKLRILINQYPQYKRIIEILLKKSQIRIDENSELKKLRIDFKNQIENIISSGNIESAKKLISEYISNFEKDKDIMHIEGVIYIMENKYKLANRNLKIALAKDMYNEDLIYNIKYLNEIQN